MYFKKLELFGFKSFVDKTTLIFEPGVTAIVGPNGTGKSNIADAIKWVLGEQSAKSMRGSKMEDVIFNGTDLRPAVNVAEVTLTLSNESKQLPIDYEEVSITRRLYRSGESEYLLNKTLVRLKDIQELLMGTGIGTESYSLLEQGRIDAILSSKPEDRRVIFEEASGITKFKSKKNEALRKLEQTEENLLRVNDIITEVNRQLNSIQRQVNKARRYQEEFDRLKHMETQYAYREFNLLKSQQKNLDEDKEKFLRQQSALENELSALKNEFDKLKSALSQVETDYSRLNGQIVNASAQMEKNEHHITLDKERIAEFRQRVDVLFSEIENGKKRIEALEEQIAQLNQRMAVFQKDKETKETQLKEKETAITTVESQIKDANETIERNKVNTITIIAEQSKIKNELAKFSANLHNLRARLTRLNQERAKTVEELERIVAELKSRESEVASLRAKVGESERNESQLRVHKEELSLRKNNLETQLQDLKQDLVAKQSQLSVLEKVRENYEGFSGPVKALMLKKDESPESFNGVCDVLVNLVEVNPGYEVCVESALSDYLQAVIVDNEQVMLRMRDFTDANKIGRIRFISLDSLPQDKANVSDERIRNLAEVITCDPKYKGAVDFLLRHAFFVKDKNDAQSLKGNFDSSVKLVDIDGEITGRTEIISRPVIEQGLGLISQKAKIKTLREECEVAEKTVVLRQEEGEKIRLELANIEKHLSSVSEILNKGKIDLLNADSSRANIESVKKKLGEELSTLTLELDETVQDENELKDKESESRKRLEEIEQNIVFNEQEMNRLQESIKLKVQEREELLVVIAKMKTEFSLLREQEETLNANFLMYSQNLEQQRKSVCEGLRQKQESEKRIEELLFEISELEAKTRAIEEEKQQIQSKLQEITAQRDILASDFEKIQQLIREKEEFVNNVKNNLRDFDVKSVELNYKMNALAGNISQVYKVDLVSLEMELSAEVDWNAQKTQIEEIKNKLDRIGPVNLAAVEEEEELKERANFLNSQKEDLTNAKESLMQAIYKINKTTRSLFIETFEKSKETFREYFKLLFNGGDAQLILTDDKDVLESGIEIVVRPPGKKLQNISLLSGGEKTLTAIAVLFALFKVKPTPFCLMDEMDAPLDESNIDRFTRVLQEFVKSSQFIIITHNKKTIGMSDVMYGVTMEQPGISKLVSVKFSEYRESAEPNAVTEPIELPSKDLPDMPAEVIPIEEKTDQSQPAVN